MRPTATAAKLLILLSLAPVSDATRCTATSLTVHCLSRCAGVNATSVSSSNPPPEQVFEPPSPEILAQLENEVDGVRSKPKKGRSTWSLFAQVAEGATPTDDSPTVPSMTNFSDQTAYAPAHRALTPDQLAALVGPAGALDWSALSSATLHCVDGRHPTAGLFAYGGDLGEFALGLSVLEHMAQRSIGQAETTLLLEGWVKKLSEAGGGFGACIDAAASSQLQASVGLGAEGASFDMASPPEEVRPQLMTRVVSSEFVGNEHLKWMLHYPKTYATRAKLVEQAVRSFYGILWNAHHPYRKALALKTLSGARAERAVLHVHADHWCAKEQKLAPTLASKTRGGSMFVYHPDAVAARRALLVAHLATGISPPVERGELLGRVTTLGDGQMALTEKAMAGMLRSYAIMIK